MTIAADIASSNGSGEPLLLIHTTTVDVFRTICTTGQLAPQMCDVMGKDLTYFFYGRPAYRPGRIQVNNRDKDKRPVMVLFSKENLPKCAQIYPCDTGAHHKGMYLPYLAGASFPDLECASVPQAERRIVNRYFGSNSMYFYGEPLQQLSLEPESTVACGFHSLLLSDREGECDDRLLSIEIIGADAFTIRQAASYLVFPDYLQADTIVAPVLDDWSKNGVELVPYRPQGLSSAGRTVEQLFPRVGELQGL
jgi:hypothetical protein